jgi:hypothetical protein
MYAVVINTLSGSQSIAIAAGWYVPTLFPSLRSKPAEPPRTSKDLAGGAAVSPSNLKETRQLPQRVHLRMSLLVAPGWKPAELLEP